MSVLERMANLTTKMPTKEVDSFKGTSEIMQVKKERSEKKSEQFLGKLEKKGFNLTELEPIIKRKGNQLIIAGAGSGKTTAMVCKIQYDILTGELTKLVDINGQDRRVMANVLVSTFLKTGALELRKSLQDLQRSMGIQDTSSNIKFSTLHAEFYEALRGLGYSFDVISESANQKLLRSVIKSRKIKYNGRPMNSKNEADLMQAIAYSRTFLDKKKRYLPKIYNQCTLTPLDIDEIINAWGKLRSVEEKIDFQDMEELLYNLCYVQQKEEVIAYLSSRYDYIFIDEFQDTSEMQYALVKVLAKNAKKIVAIGDDDQLIYSWRGSAINIIMEEFREDFDAKVDTLTLNYRCPENILNVVIPSIEKNSTRLSKKLKAANSGGMVEVMGYKNYQEASGYLFDKVYGALEKDKSVAILTRTNFGGLIPALALEDKGRFNFSISSSGMTLNNYIGRMVLKIGKLFLSSKANDIKTLLKQISWDEQWNIASMADYCEMNNLTIFQLSDEDLMSSLPRVGELIIGWKDLFKQGYSESQIFQIVLNDYKELAFNTDSNFDENSRAVIDLFIFLIDSWDLEKVSEVLTKIVQLNRTLEARVEKNSNKRVKIATVHEFKGKEADVVILWDDSKGVFPPVSESLDDVEAFEEERRVHYIALTRAREEEYIIYNKAKPSIFFQELDLQNISEYEKL